MASGATILSSTPAFHSPSNLLSTPIALDGSLDSSLPRSASYTYIPSIIDSASGSPTSDNGPQDDIQIKASPEDSPRRSQDREARPSTGRTGRRKSLVARQKVLLSK